jgi:type I restriction enzyme S subunit
MFIALLAAAVTMLIVPPDAQYLDYFDFKTLACLFCTLAVVCALKNVNFFYQDNECIGLVKDGAGVGRVMRLPPFSSVIGTVMIVRPQAGADSGYLYYALSKQNLGALYSGAAIPHLYFKDFKDRKINLPHLPEQKRIAAVLDKICELKKNAEAQIENLDLLVKSRFVEMFGDPRTNAKKWSLSRLDALCENLDGRRIPITSSYRNPGNIPYYGASGIVDYVKDYIYDEDILLISEDGANLKMRSSPIAFSVSGKCWVNNHAHVVRFKEKATQKFVEYHIEMSDISAMLTGSAQPKLNQAQLNSMKIMVPPLALQQKFAAFVEKVEKLKDVAKKSVEEMDTLYRAKLQEYFG